MSELPPTWVRAPLQDIAQTSSGGTPSRSKPELFGGPIPWVKSGELNDGWVLGAEETITEEGLARSSAKVFPAGTPCVALYGATVGRVGMLGMDAATNQAVCAMTPGDGVSARYLFYFIQSRRQDLVARSQGGAQPNISQSILRELEVPVCPPPEQDRIVAEIEKQFTRLDAATAALKRVQANLKRYRASVLKAACEGRLVPTEAELARKEGRDYEPADQLLKRILRERRARWESETLRKFIAAGDCPTDDRWKQRYKEPAAPNLAKLPKLPRGWCWATVEQVGLVQLGRQRSPQNHDGPYMTPYLRVANVFEDRIDSSDVKWMNFTPAERVAFGLQEGDILLNEGQSLELVGRPAMYRNELEQCCFQNTLVRFRSVDSLAPAYALSVFLAHFHSGRFRSIARWTTSIAHLGAERFAAIEFPLPPANEQHRIASAVEMASMRVRRLQIALSKQLDRAASLRNAVLGSAFSGNLVPQDPNDEPAPALLDRARPQRVPAAPRGRTRRKKEAAHV